MSKQGSEPASIVAEFRQDLDRLLAETASANLSSNSRRKLELDIRQVVAGLSGLLNTLDPIRQPSSMFDPSNPKVVGRFISLALVAQDRVALRSVVSFYGSGVYAIYYTGDFPLYAAIAGTETPIYVGQAAPAINNARTPMEQGDRLSRRLSDHRRNVGLASTTLNLDNFDCRFLVVQSGWETAAEDYLIHLFHPIWNSETKILFGLGKHGDSATTRANRRSPWDTLHPGRKWAAESTQDAKTPQQIALELDAHFAEHPVFTDLDALLRSFIEELKQL